MTTGPIPEVFDRARLIAFLKKFFAVKGAGGGSSCCDNPGPEGALQYNSSGDLTGSAKMTFDGDDLVVASMKISDTTSGRVMLAGSSGAVTDNADFTFNGTVLQSPQMSASAFVTPAGQLGMGDVKISGTPSNNQLAVWTNSTTAEGDSNLTWDGSKLTTTQISASSAISASALYVNGTTVGTGDVTTTGTPANNQIAVWTNSNTVEGNSNLTWDGNTLKVVTDPSGLEDNTGTGDIVTFGNAADPDSFSPGRLFYLSGSDWRYPDADNDLKGGTQLLGIALGAAPSQGLLLKGYFDAATYLAGFSAGLPVYVSRTPSEMTTALKNLTDNGAYIRVVGYCTPDANVIYFNPSTDYTSGSEG